MILTSPNKYNNCGPHVSPVCSGIRRVIRAQNLPLPNKTLRVAIWDDNRSFEERRKHPGAQNIQTCLQNTCWTECTCRGNCPAQKERPGNKELPYTRSVFVTGELKFARSPPLARFCRTLLLIEVDYITGAMIRDGFLTEESIDVVLFPGGSSKKQSRILSGIGQRKLLEFVKSGGGFVGGFVLT